MRVKTALVCGFLVIISSNMLKKIEAIIGIIGKYIDNLYLK